MKRSGMWSTLALCGLLAVAGAIEESRRPSRSWVPLSGEQVYVAEGCIHCHSQFSRAGTEDVWRYGPATSSPERTGEATLIGNRRQGPDLANVAFRRSREWNRVHLIDPQGVSPGSRMPSYARLFEGEGRRGEALLDYLESLATDRGSEWLNTVDSWRPRNVAIPDVERGSTLYAQLCVQCHGAGARGDGPLAGRFRMPPRDWVEEPWRFVFGEPGDAAFVSRLQQVVKYGIPGTSMPGHEYLGDQQIVDLALYVASLKGNSSNATE